MSKRRSTFQTVANPTTDVEAIVTPPADPDLSFRRRIFMAVAFISAVAVVILTTYLIWRVTA